MFVSYTHEGLKLANLITKKVIVSKDVIFVEDEG